MKFSIYLIVLILFVTEGCQAQANSTILLLNNIEISFMNRGSRTDFYIRSPLGSNVNPNRAWLGVGFNSAARMVVFTNLKL